MIENIPQEQLPVVQPTPNSPKIWLPFVIALMVVALVSGGGVYLWQQNKVVAEPSTVSYITPTKTETQVISESQITLGDISMTVPSKWKVESTDSKSARILTDYPNYKVELLVSLENSNLTESNYESSYDNTKTKYGEAFKVAQGGAFNVTGVKINGKLYSFNWEISSDEPTPSSLDGIWTPKHNVTESDIWNMTISSKPVDQTISQDTRTLLTTSNAYNENTVKMGGMAGKACDEEFNHELANTNVTYKNIDKGLELSIPYNKNWGSKNYKINPYDEEKTGISFGEFTIGEGCSWLRNYYLSFETIKSKELVKKEILANDVTAANNIKEYSLKNMPVFMWTQEGPGCWTGAEFIGVKANYKFSFNGNCDEGKDLKTLEMLASLMKQI